MAFLFFSYFWSLTCKASISNRIFILWVYVCPFRILNKLDISFHVYMIWYDQVQYDKSLIWYDQSLSLFHDFSKYLFLNLSILSLSSYSVLYFSFSSLLHWSISNDMYVYLCSIWIKLQGKIFSPNVWLYYYFFWKTVFVITVFRPVHHFKIWFPFIQD